MDDQLDMSARNELVGFLRKMADLTREHIKACDQRAQARIGPIAQSYAQLAERGRLDLRTIEEQIARLEALG